MNAAPTHLGMNRFGTRLASVTMRPFLLYEDEPTVRGGALSLL